MTEMPSLPDSWVVAEPAQAEALVAEAVREIGPSHPLFGRGLTTVALCRGCDHVLFRLDDESWAIVHLTWTSAREPAPWPNSTQCDSCMAVEMEVDAHSADEGY